MTPKSTENLEFLKKIGIVAFFGINSGARLIITKDYKTDP
jgi:hypothetical protein